jgi:hypothetical protein
MLKSEKKLKCLCYYFSNGIANLLFFEIRDQGVINGLDLVLILKSETKVRLICTGPKIFFSYLERKSFAALRFAHNEIL